MNTHPENRFVDSTETLADLVDYLADQIRVGNEIDLQKLCDRYPQHSAELQQLVPAVLAMDSLGASQGDFDSSLSVPKTLGGFQLIRQIGRGGMGVVYLARQPELDRNVAIKVLPFASLLDKRQLDRFKVEARAAAILKHPNIVSVFTFGSEQGVHYYVMEYVDGLSLSEVLTADSDELQTPTSRPASPAAETHPIANLSTQGDSATYCRSIARLGVNIARALHYAHRQGVVHRDIKPSNVMLDGDGNVKITDFGLARIQSGSDLTMTGDAIGTLRYMSPEQLSDKGVVDGRTDIYALGLTLYEMLARQPAFGSANRDESRSELLKQVLESDPTPLWNLNKRTPLPLATVIHKAATKEIDLRYRTAADFADDLQRFLDERPVLARRPTVWQKSLSWIRRNRQLAAAAGIALAALLTLAIAGPIAAFQLSSALTAEQEVSNQLTEEQRQLNGQIYCQRIREAINAAQKGNYLPAKNVIEEFDPVTNPLVFGNEEPGFEYWYLKTLSSADEERVIWPNGIDVMMTATSPDGSLVAAGSWLGNIGVWRKGETKPLQAFWMKKGAVAPAMGLTFSDDGRFLACVGARTAAVWDTQSWQRADIPWPHDEASRTPQGYWHCAFSEVGDDLVLATAEMYWNYNINGEARVHFYKVARGVERPSLKHLHTIKELQGAAYRIAFSSDGSTVYVADRTPSIRRWSLPDFKEGPEFRCCNDNELINELVAHPRNPRWLFTGTVEFQPGKTASKLVLVNTSNQSSSIIQRRSLALSSLAINKPGDRLCVGYDDGQIWQWKIKDEDQGLTLDTPKHVQAHVSAVQGLAYGVEERLYSAGGDGSFESRSISEFEEQPSRSLHVEGFVADFCWLPQGDEIVCAYMSKEFVFRHWDTRTGRMLRECPIPGESMEVLQLCVLPDGKRVAYACFKYPSKDFQHIGVWNLQNNETQVLAEGTLGVNCSVGLSPDHRKLITTLGNKIRLYDSTTLELLETQPMTHPFRASPHPKKNLLTLFATEVRVPEEAEPCVLYDLDKQAIVRPLDWNVNRRGYQNILFSPDGLHMVALFGGDATIWKDWERSEKPTLTLQGSRMPIWNMDFSADGNRMVLAGMDSTISLRSTITGSELLSLRTQAEWNFAARFSPDGNTLAYGGGKGTIYGTIFLVDALKVE